MSKENRICALLLVLLGFMANLAYAENYSVRSVVYDLSRWPYPQHIPVCFMNRNEVSPEIISDVVEAIDAEFHAKTAIRFAGFDDCNDSDLRLFTIRVQFNRIHNWSGNSRTTAGGGLSFIGPSRASCGIGCGEGSMRLDIGITGDYPGEAHPGRPFARQQTRAAAVHEFGHALGLAHEHARSDATACSDLAEEIADDGTYVYVGAYDPHSIMNYCRTDNKGSLSEGDREAIAFLYPPVTKN